MVFTIPTCLQSEVRIDPALLLAAVSFLTFICALLKTINTLSSVAKHVFFRHPPTSLPQIASRAHGTIPHPLVKFSPSAHACCITGRLFPYVKRPLIIAEPLTTSRHPFFASSHTQPTHDADNDFLANTIVATMSHTDDHIRISRRLTLLAAQLQQEPISSEPHASLRENNTNPFNMDPNAKGKEDRGMEVSEGLNGERIRRGRQGEEVMLFLLSFFPSRSFSLSSAHAFRPVFCPS
ncbi:hypothetical protein NLI96_g11929 [Meripilus lineatus]|uniref:Uncharacterized protein n=1 Tax=Meripilus lineatus TaxID=2056292 RepID=A0AAD5USA6_9APHY|nr:hypothetical protein NLI96_g11929 [Physisporinus lineatus]